MNLKLFITSIILVFSLYFFLEAKTIYAVENPLASPNNPFGIHILEEDDLEDAAALVNSSGGDWGYITLVIRKDERDSERWQKVFDRMRRLHLIPIVRIATRQEDSRWEKPVFDEIDGWVSFLNSLNWVTKNRYVIIGNEPNHAKEWGGEVNPSEYAAYLKTLLTRLKGTSDDFFILPAGLDASAPNDREHMSETLFLNKMLESTPDVFDRIDGWTSHSYPNPKFSGSETATGPGTIRTFEWELDILKKLGIKKELPVFITETGWAHEVDGQKNGYKASESIANALKNSFTDPWKDKRIVAVTPFVLDYKDAPFDIFSWKKPGGSFYPFYYEVQKMEKLKGEPIQVTSGKILVVVFPSILKRHGKNFGLAYIKNTGQAIWSAGKLTKISDGLLQFEIEPILLSNTEPNQNALVFFRVSS